MTHVSIMRDVRDPLGLHLNQKDLKLGRKWPSYCQFTKERLRDSSEYHEGCRGSIWASFEPKRSKIGQEMACLSHISIRRLRVNLPDLCEQCFLGCVAFI